MIYELDELILTNKLLNMSLSELFSFDAIVAVESITGNKIDLELPCPPILTNILKTHADCFRNKIDQARKELIQEKLARKAL